jgi:hypothetical protein
MAIKRIKESYMEKYTKGKQASRQAGSRMSYRLRFAMASARIFKFRIRLAKKQNKKKHTDEKEVFFSSLHQEYRLRS